MKILFIVLSFVFATNGFCSWPDKTFSAVTITNSPQESLSPYLEGIQGLVLSTTDYREVRLTFDSKTKEFLCIATVAYYEEQSWLAGGWEDKEQEGWSRRPSDGIENIHSDLGSLLGILDQASIKSRRLSIIRTDRKTKRVRAIWNKVEFSVPSKDLSILFMFFRDFYGDYRPDTKVSLWLTRKVEVVPPNGP